MTSLRGRAFEQKNWSEFKSPAYARPPPPQQLNIDRCISEMDIFAVTRYLEINIQTLFKLKSAFFSLFVAWNNNLVPF